MTATTPPLPLGTRIWFAWVCFFRVLFDSSFAARAWSARDTRTGGPSGPDGEAHAEPGLAAPEPGVRPAGAPAPPATDAVLSLLGLLQREGRLVDFLQQDVAGFSDADIGAAARVVHEGCRKALGAHVKILPVRDEREGGAVTLDQFDPSTVKLVGNVGGARPFRGTVRHRGWRVEALSLPQRVAGADASVIAPAEVEL